MPTPVFYQVFGSVPFQAHEQSLFALENARGDISRLKSQLEQLLLTDTPFEDFELEYEGSKAGTALMLLNARQFRSLSNEAAVLLAFEDVTERRKAEMEAARDMRETGQELDRTKEELRALALDLMHAQEEEARRIACELHDSFAQRLASLEITIEQYRLGAIADHPTELRQLLDLLREHIAQLSNDVRTLSHRMHPSSLEHLDLQNALKSLAREFKVIRSTPVYFSRDVVHTSLANAG